MNIGDTIIIKDEHIDHIDAIANKMNDAKCMMRTGSSILRSSEKELWDFIHATIPETIGMNISLNHEKHKIDITGVL